MGIITWIIVGFLAGLIARAIMPGRQHLGFIMTTLLGIVGSLVGGLIGTAIWGRGNGQGFTPGGLVLSILGALLVLFVVGRFRAPARTHA